MYHSFSVLLALLVYNNDVIEPEYLLGESKVFNSAQSIHRFSQLKEQIRHFYKTHYIAKRPWSAGESEGRKEGMLKWSQLPPLS